MHGDGFTSKPHNFVLVKETNQTSHSLIRVILYRPFNQGKDIGLKMNCEVSTQFNDRINV